MALATDSDRCHPVLIGCQKANATISWPRTSNETNLAIDVTVVGPALSGAGPQLLNSICEAHATRRPLAAPLARTSAINIGPRLNSLRSDRLVRSRR